mmetsp:Transcript_64436/g.119853  ORF Transcript_64436/g.119853 Transcript_64436/m.119853 type:complete len:239 (-) Transcript_64436:127-843(-)
MATLTPVHPQHTRTLQPTSALKVFPAAKQAAVRSTGGPAAPTVPAANPPLAARSPPAGSRVVMTAAKPAAAAPPAQHKPALHPAVVVQASSTLSRAPATLSTTSAAAPAPARIMTKPQSFPPATAVDDSSPETGRMPRRAVVQPLSGAGPGLQQAPLATNGKAQEATNGTAEREKFTLKPSVGTWLQVPASEKQQSEPISASDIQATVDAVPMPQATAYASCWAGIMKIFQKKPIADQ